MMHEIELKNVSKVYTVGEESVTVLFNLSFTIEKGEFIAVTGPSGCGKSTLLHMIGGLNGPTSGTICLQGQDLYKMDRSKRALYRRRTVGIVYQFYNLVPELTAEENLLLPALMDRKRIAQGKVDEILEILGMSDKRYFYPGQLSGGQQQKLAVGRALIQRPSLLLADEPTGNLDSEKRDEILTLFRRLNEEEDMTILIVTHDPVVGQTAKRNIRMMDGRILADEVRI